MPTPDVSIVLPCYRAAALARESVRSLRDALAGSDLTWEVIVVDDGGGDFEDDEWGSDPRVRLLTSAVNRGKGAAVRLGMLEARGRVRVYTDIDLPFGFEPIMAMVSAIRDHGAHLAIGDRTLPGSEYRLQLTWPRRAASFLFTAFVGSIVTGGFYDTQCGLKAVRGDVADALFPLLRIDRFVFDVEIVYIALKHRLRIARLPVRLVHNETTSVRLLRDSSQGFVDVFRIRYHQLRSFYRSPRLDEIAAQRTDASDSRSSRTREVARL